MASRLFGPSVTPKRTIMAPASEVSVRVATPDYTLLPSLAAKATDTTGNPTFTLDLFDDVEVTAEVVRTEATPSGGIAIIARLPALQYGNAVLVQNGNVLTGSVTFMGGTYSILPDAEGNVRIAKINPALLPPEGEPRVVPGAAATFADLMEADPPADSGKRIDVIVFWTAAAQRRQPADLPHIQNNIDTAITLTNTAYRNSGIAQRVRLVNKQKVNYSEATGDPFGDALNALTAGSIPTVAASTVGAQRNAYGADDIVLVINDPSFCGLAWLPSTISVGNANSSAGAVVGGGTCLTTNFSFGHELGHNMGAHHDPYVAPGPGAFAYSHGLSHLGGSNPLSWRTIMAYNNQCQATYGGSGCTRLQYFSNPMVTFPADGSPMGDGSVRNNALTLNKSANAVSNYRPTVVPVTQTFVDVTLADPQFGYVEFMYQAGFTNGCSASPLAVLSLQSRHARRDGRVPRAQQARRQLHEDAHRHGVHRRPRGRAFRGLHRAALCRRHHQRVRPGTGLLPQRPGHARADGEVPADHEVRRWLYAGDARLEPVLRRATEQHIAALYQEALRPRHHARLLDLADPAVLPERRGDARHDGNLHLPDLPARRAERRLHAMTDRTR